MHGQSKALNSRNNIASDMALLLEVLALFLGTVASLTLMPTVVRLIGRFVGRSVSGRTSQRRELLLERAASEDRRGKSLSDDTDLPAAGSLPKGSPSSLDEDWEKVHAEFNLPAAGADPFFTGIVAFFHPYCNAGGGGERVLFAAIQATQQRYPHALCVVYTGDHDASKTQILSNARTRFNISLNAPRIAFLYLGKREWVQPSKWPHFTLLGQSLGSIIIGWEAFNLLVPDLFIDTMGYAFVLALSKWLFPLIPTAAYVHYPTISTDMLSSLESPVSSEQGLNAGKGTVGLRGVVKRYYWRLFAALYAYAGGSVDIVLTNSSWTQRHIASLWGSARRGSCKTRDPVVVYPPCAVEELCDKIQLDDPSEQSRTRDVLYIAQFRPEKMHSTIIEAFLKFLQTRASTVEPPSNLILLGSVRDAQDEKLVYKLRLQAQEAKGRIQFVINAKWPQILSLLSTCSVGINGMWNEHFGIGVVEYQAAGLISVVNDSGGPKEDIVVDIDGQPTGVSISTIPIALALSQLTFSVDRFADLIRGFLASNSAQFSQHIEAALSLSPEETLAMRLRARKSALRFSGDIFEKAWVKQLDLLVESFESTHRCDQG